MSFPEQPFGFVAGRWVLSIGDTPDDPDRAPDYVPVRDGTVVFTPQVTHRVAADGSGWAGIIKDRVLGGIGERGQLVDAEGHDHLALAVGIYSVSYDFGSGWSWPSHYIEVKPEHTADAPLWLPPIAPPPEGPRIENRVITIPADGSDGQVLVWDGAGFSWMDAPAGPKGDQGDPGTSDIVVDTSVGTRVFANGIMVHGDTGWRALSSWDETGAVTGLPLASESWEPTPGRAGGIFVRRNLDKVRIIVSALTRASTTNAAVFADHTVNRIPVGFRPQNTETLVGLRSPTEFATLTLPTNGMLSRASGSMTGANGNIDISAEVEAKPDWPATQPGTPA